MQPLDSLALVLAAGIGCQWLASRLHIPALILLLACGLVLGPVTHLLVPTQQFGLILMPAIKLGVAIILFEGGLNLHFHELKGTAQAIRRLATLSIPVAWLLASAAAHYIGGLGLASCQPVWCHHRGDRSNRDFAVATPRPLKTETSRASQMGRHCE